MEHETQMKDQAWNQERAHTSQKIAEYEEEIRRHRRANELDEQAMADKEAQWQEHLAREHQEHKNLEKKWEDERKAIETRWQTHTQELEKRWKDRKKELRNKLRSLKDDLKQERSNNKAAEAGVVATAEKFKRKLNKLNDELKQYRTQIKVLRAFEKSKRDFEKAYNAGFRRAISQFPADDHTGHLEAVPHGEVPLA